MAGATTNSYSFASNFYFADIVLEIYERLGWRAASLTPDMMQSAFRSFNLVQAIWSNRGVNLWEVAQENITLVQGVATYTLDSTHLAILPAPVVNMWSLSTITNIASNAFTTTSSSNIVTVNQPSNGQLVGNYINVATPAAVGGTIVFGFYPVLSTPTSSTYTIQVATAATSGTTDGQTPTFTTDGTTENVTVALTNHGFLAGQTFNVEVLVAVGGLNLQGQYLITSITNANTFVIDATTASSSVGSVQMNAGAVQIQTQVSTQGPIARVLYPLSRPDYNSIANKSQQGQPTSFWFDRTTVPTLTFWPTPDANGPYQFQYYKLGQMQDAQIGGATIPDIPYRFQEAYCSAVAAHLAMKWRPELATALAAYATQMWKEASDADREVVGFFVGGDMNGYFQG